MKDYVCTKCKKQFDHRQSYYYHINKKIPCDRTMDKQEHECQMKKLQEEKESEIAVLQKLVETKTVPQNLPAVAVPPVLSPVFSSVVPAAVPASGATFNNCIVGNVVNQNIVQQKLSNKNLNFKICLAPHYEERFNHISDDEVLEILNNDNFSKSIANLTEAVYFHPKAPENIRWCIDDQKSHFGALEYSHETNSLHRAVPSEVISKNLQSLIFGMSDRFEELRENNVFNVQQANNYNRYFNLIGLDEFRIEDIAGIKDKAYEARAYTKSLWDRLGLTETKAKIPIRTYKKK